MSNIYAILKNFPYLSKRIIFLADILITLTSFLMSYVICFQIAANSVFVPDRFMLQLLICITVTGIFFLIFKTNSGLLRYSTFRDAMRIFLSVLCANSVLVIINRLLHGFYGSSSLSGEGYIVNFVLTFNCIFFYRMTVRLLFDFARNSQAKATKNIPLLIYGVGSASVGLAKMLLSNDNLPYRIVGFLTPHPEISRKEILNTPVYYLDDIFYNIPLLKRIKAILINPKEIERSEKQFLADKCLDYKIDILSAPPVEDWCDWEKNLREIKKVKIEDLLGRIPIQIDIQSIGKNLKGKTILITGAAGSIGSEIVRQISRFDLGLLLVCDIAETPLHQLGLELEDKFIHIPYISIIADVKNYRQMEIVFEKYRPHYVYHAAAYKHVPLMEQHPCETVLTNVYGSRNMVDLSVIYKVEAFVMVSTDKAVNPSNVMGASKRIAEIYVQSLNRKLKKQFSTPPVRIITTRFGNVLGSNGSVIPRFNTQIKQGGPVTVTDPDIIRYFMTIPEACRLVLEAGNMGKGGEVFVFDMGESVKIKDLAEKMIRLSGLEPYKDIEIKFTGLRPGEKLHEELLYDKEKIKETHNSKIMIGEVAEYDYEQIIPLITRLIDMAREFDKIGTVKLMKKLVPEFISQNSVYSVLDEEFQNCLETEESTRTV